MKQRKLSTNHKTLLFSASFLSMACLISILKSVIRNIPLTEETGINAFQMIMVDVLMAAIPAIFIITLAWPVLLLAMILFCLIAWLLKMNPLTPIVVTCSLICGTFSLSMITL